MRTSTATLIRTASLLLSFSACGSGGILLGSNADPSLTDAGPTGETMGPGADASSAHPTFDASVGQPGQDATGSPDASGSTGVVDAGSPGDSASASDGNPGPGFAALSTCGYTQVDPHNCGMCGHDCAGGACQAGVCVPLPAGVLASGLIAPTSVVVDANNVYWLSEGEHWTADRQGTAGLVQVMKCAKTGCNNSPTVLASGTWEDPAFDVVMLPAKDTLHGLTVDDTTVYWAAESGLYACAIDGCNNSPTVLFATPGNIIAPPSAISVRQGVVYSSDGYGVFGCTASGGCIGDGGGAGTSNVLWTGMAQSVLADSTTAYWTTSGSLLSCAIGGCSGAPTLLEQLMAPVGQMAADDTHIYFSAGGPTAFKTGNGPGYVVDTPLLGNVFSCSKQGIASGGTPLVGMVSEVGMPSGAELTSPMGLTTDGTNAYFTELGNGDAANATDVGRVGKCAVTGCTWSARRSPITWRTPAGSPSTTAASTGPTLAPASSTRMPSGFFSVDGRIMKSAK